MFKSIQIKFLSFHFQGIIQLWFSSKNSSEELRDIFRRICDGEHCLKNFLNITYISSCFNFNNPFRQKSIGKKYKNYKKNKYWIEGFLLLSSFQISKNIPEILRVKPLVGPILSNNKPY